jgi:hypothetical protein
MRKVSLIVGLSLLAVASTARAQEVTAPAGDAPAADPAATPPVVAATPAPAAAASDSKMQLGLSLLPMALGKWSASGGGASVSGDLALAYGVGVSFGYVVIPGLTIGLAPQAVFHVIPKDASGSSAKEYDIMARVAYAYTVAPKFALYAEVLPGYSIVTAPDGGDSAKGLAVAGGVGAMMDVTDQMFVNLGVGYQLGLQKVSGNDAKFSFLRIALGVGMKL